MTAAAPMPRQPPKFPIVIAPSYLADLRARVEAIGVGEVARAGRLSRQTAWRALSGGDGRRPNPDAIERIRRAVVKLEPDRPPPPPPLVVVRGDAHHAWIALADKLTAAELEPELKNAYSHRAQAIAQLSAFLAAQGLENL